jgi:hypothetical protein
MPWVRYDDNVANHPKVAPLDDASYRLWREALEWCAHNLTDGVIRTHQLGVTSVRASKPRAARLVDSGLWHNGVTPPCDSPKCPPAGPDGWVIHDYWDYQPTRQKVREDQEATRERQRRYMERARSGKRGVPNVSVDAVTNGVSDAVNNGNPAPPRPEGRRGRAPQSLPAAGGDGAAADAKSNQTPRCPRCGNRLSSAHHRNVCAKAGAA